MDHERLNRAVQHICGHAATFVGREFFPAIVKDLHDLMGADITLVGELVEHGRAIDTLAIHAHGEPAASMRYTLADCPCEQVVGSDACGCSDPVTGLFPGDDILQALGVRGYVGVPVYGAHGDSVGVIVALFKEAVREDDLAKRMLELFAGRVGAEIDRVRAETRAFELERQRTESLAAFSSGLANDFNNVLTRVNCSVDLASCASSLSGAMPHLSEIRTSTAEAIALCEQLLAYSGRGSFVLEVVDIAQMLHQQKQLLSSCVGARAQLVMDTPVAGALAEVDVAQVRQAVHNLVLNAAEAFESEGRVGSIWVSARIERFGPEQLRTPQHEPLPGGRYVVIEVRDDGPGMTCETSSRIFDPFFTTKLAGRGLGLSALLGIARGHGGTIQVRSQLGQGTTFSVLLPVATRRAPQRRGRSAPPTNGRMRVLLVDDEVPVRKVVRRLLSYFGHEVVEAGDGAQAVEALAAEGNGIQLVLMDIRMPRMGGIEAFLTMRDSFPGLPVILMSGYSESVISEELGSPLFLQKPFGRQGLHTALERARALPRESS